MENKKIEEYCSICGVRIDPFGVERHADWCPKLHKDCYCKCCKEHEIERLKKEIKSDIKSLKSYLNLGFFDSYLFDMTSIAETQAKQLYEKVIKLKELEG